MSVLIDLIALPGRDYGALDADASHLACKVFLAASPARPALLFLHHPPFVTGIAHMDVQNLRNAGEFAAILRQHQRASAGRGGGTPPRDSDELCWRGSNHMPSA